MATGIYLIGQNETLVALEERRYDLEADLQHLLARYPDLLAGDPMDTTTPALAPRPTRAGDPASGK